MRFDLLVEKIIKGVETLRPFEDFEAGRTHPDAVAGQEFDAARDEGARDALHGAGLRLRPPRLDVGDGLRGDVRFLGQLVRIPAEKASRASDLSW